MLIALVTIVDVVILMPIAIVLLETSCGEAKNWAGSMLQMMRTSVVHPIIISITAGLCLSLLEVPFIVPVDSFIQLLGAAAAAGALFALDAFLGVNPRGSGLTIVTIVTILKLLAYLALVWITITMVFDVNLPWAMVGTLLAALATA